MKSLENINALIAENRISDALAGLDEIITADPENHDALVMRGRLRWRVNDRGGAVTDYNRALKLRPDGPARELLQMSNDILDFFNPDLLNP